MSLLIQRQEETEDHAPTTGRARVGIESAPLAGYSPVTAATAVLRRPTDALAFDCFTLVVVRSGTAILTSDQAQMPVVCGDVITLGRHALYATAPEGEVALTTIRLDVDYILDQVFWQHSSLFPDRHAATAAFGAIYPEPVQIARLGHDRLDGLAPLLDELVMLSQAGRIIARFFRVQGIVSVLVDAILPHVTHRPPPMPAWDGVHLTPVVPRWRQFRPVRREAIAVEALLRSDVSRRWTLAVLCDRVHLSDKQLVRVFVDAYGKTPNTYLAMLRVEEMARLLRETDIPVALAMRRVGWNSRGHAADIFRRHIGVTPARYRHYGPPSNNAEGMGSGAHLPGESPAS